jgi:crotonobetainyl-CoA:carnitine CoA-transferase CaiB-like acyl-CoA transferase
VSDARPLAGIVVVDASRMLPGAVLARMLLDLGARVVKVEAPRLGDPMRAIPPLAGETSAVFQALHAGAESIALDLSSSGGAAALRRVARHADVLVESFRPGTMERWGLGAERLMAANPLLVHCAIPAFGAGAGDAAAVPAHDVNLAAMSGLLALLPGEGVPGVQVTDIAAGMLACAAILAALLVRQRTGRGGRVEQPLAGAALPFLAWPIAAHALGAPPVFPPVSGAAPAYRLYTCGDGARVALGALEPKFWDAFVEALELPELAGDGLDVGEAGARAAARVAARLAGHPRAHWLALAAARGLPLTPVHDLDAALREPLYAAAMRELPAEEGTVRAPRPFLDFPAPPAARAPALGEGTARILAEFGASDEEIAVATA